MSVPHIVKPAAHAELVGRREHALVDAAHEHDVRLAIARVEQAQQLHAVAVGQMQVHQDHVGRKESTSARNSAALPALATA